MLTQEKLKELLNYDPDTGVFTWAKTRNGVSLGKKAGGVSGKGYIAIYINGRNYLAHRLAWLYCFGVFPDQIDHINQDKTDNRICNLQTCDTITNNRNRSINRRSKTQIHGVRYKSNRWEVSIGIDARHKYLGRFTDFFDACCCRKSAEHKCGYIVNHGLSK